MIIVKAPLRISFVGGGTDLPDFYRLHPGRVISTAIDKYVYVAINPTPLMKQITARYSSFEIVKHPSELKNDRIRAALLDLGIYSNIDITTFSHLPVKTGLGSSSSFAVALMKGLYAYLGKKIDKREAAEQACRLEIELLGEPIGKQDQYAAAFGGLNLFQFNPDESVDVHPLFLDYKTRSDFEKSLLLFFTGITRDAATVLKEQKEKINLNLESLKEIADLPLKFQERLMRADFEGLGKLLHENWLKKKSLASKISNPIIDELYQSGLEAGAWGGKILGAGGGGCLLFMAPPEKMAAIREALMRVAAKNQLEEAREIPFHFVQSGVEVWLDHSIHS
jgi:D-glycero-alpha-D-manno-heptose-7-phosphate kinase